MVRCISRKCLINCTRSFLVAISLFSFYYVNATSLFDWHPLFTQVDWKPEAPEKFGDITDLAKSVSSLNIDEGKKQGCLHMIWAIATLIFCSFIYSLLQDKIPNYHNPPTIIQHLLLKNLLHIDLLMLRVLLQFRNRYVFYIEVFGCHPPTQVP